MVCEVDLLGNRKYEIAEQGFAYLTNLRIMLKRNAEVMQIINTI